MSENPDEKPAKKEEKLKIDAIAADGVLSLLNTPTPSDSRRHTRSLSAGTKAELDAQLLQTRFQAHRMDLQRYLVSAESMIYRMVGLNREAALKIPPAGLQVLHVDVKLGSSSLKAAGMAPDVIEQRLLQVLKHAKRLGQRLADSRSRVLVTGDLNAGKSSLCNKLLRRRVLPVDQQPCTDVFCEVIDASKNGGIEEVHAIKVLPNKPRAADKPEVITERSASRRNSPFTASVGSASSSEGARTEGVPTESAPTEGTPTEAATSDSASVTNNTTASNGTSNGMSNGLSAGVDSELVEGEYDRFPLSELPELVHRPDKYRLLIVYIKDPRPPTDSLLSNGVVDICLIDAPGLNVSEVTTTELFGRQEEIDLVIFVVSAENHFTQSAREFVADAAREKSLLFVAVNNFDRIRDKERCRNRVLNQIAELAPETHKGAADFVHFGAYSDRGDPDNAPPDAPQPDGPPDGGDPSALEVSLRNFILEKRSASKLAPARTYLLNVLRDIILLCQGNRKIADHERNELAKQLDSLVPEIDSSVSEYAAVSEQLERDTERLVAKLQHETESKLTTVVSEIGEEPLLPWPGIAHTFTYAAETRSALVQRVLEAVESAENDAREATSTAVSAIKQLGILHVGDRPAFAKVFQKSAMFSRRKDNLSRHIQAEFGVADLFDIGLLLERPLPVLKSSKAALLNSQASSTGVAVTAASLAASSLLPMASALAPLAPIIRVLKELNIRRLTVPVIAFAAAALGAWAIHELPRTIPRRLARKIAFELDEMGYVRSNASRIAGEARKVLRYPAQDVRSAFQSLLESRTRQRDDYELHLQQAEYMLSVLTEIEDTASQDVEGVKSMTL